MSPITSIRWSSLHLMLFIPLCSLLLLIGCADSDTTERDTLRNGLVLNEELQSLISGSADVHLVSLPPVRHSYTDAWTYQFGDPNATPAASSVWTSNAPTYSCTINGQPATCKRHNMECGPASAQIIERLTGRSGASCTYQRVIAGCEDYPSVHSDCRAVGACGKVTNGYNNDSFSGTNGSQMKTVLEDLGYKVVRYGNGTTHVDLNIVKQAIDKNHPIIVALSPITYSSETGYAYPDSKGRGVTSHFVVIIGYGSTCKNKKTTNSDNSGHYVYMLDPGWRAGQFACISDDMFNQSLQKEGTYTGIEVTRPGFNSSTASATWYPPGTLLRIENEYYYVTLPDTATGSMRMRHASPDALKANRISIDRAITVSYDVLGCSLLTGEMDTAVHLREYREPSGTIYLVDIANKQRGYFINYAAYLSFGGNDEWKQTTQEEIDIWSSYPETHAFGLDVGMLVTTDKPGVSTVWAVSYNDHGSFRLPIINESTANVYGYDLSKIGTSPRFSATVHYEDLDKIAGPEGQMLTEEMSRLCVGRMCLAAAMCFSVASDAGGGEDGLVGNGACGDCQEISPDATGTGGTSGTGGAPSTGGAAATGTCTRSDHRCISGQSTLREVCVLDSYTNTTYWETVGCTAGWSCTDATGICGTPISTSATGGAPSTGGVPATGGITVSTGGIATGGLPPTGGVDVVVTGGSPPATGGVQVSTGGVYVSTGGIATGGNPPSTGGLPPTGGMPPATGGSPPTGNTPCLDAVSSRSLMECLDLSGKLYIRTDAFVLNDITITDAEISQGLWHVYVWYDFATSPPWWGELDILSVPGYPGVGAVTVPASLPSGLCPFTNGMRRHPMRISAPYRGTYPDAGYNNFAMSGSMYLCTEAQDGLVEDLPNGDTPPLWGCDAAVYRTTNGGWLPAATLALSEMDNGSGLCVP